MTKFLMGAVAALALSIPALSQAQSVGEHGPGACTLQAKLQVKSLFIVFGTTEGRGRGTIECSYADGFEESIPVRVKVEGFGIGLGGSDVSVRLGATNIGVYNDGRALLGEYGLVKAGAQIGPAGGGFAAGLTANRDGLSIPLMAYAAEQEGAEVAAAFGKLVITER